MSAGTRPGSCRDTRSSPRSASLFRSILPIMIIFPVHGQKRVKSATDPGLPAQCRAARGLLDWTQSERFKRYAISKEAGTKHVTTCWSPRIRRCWREIHRCRQERRGRLAIKGVANIMSPTGLSSSLITDQLTRALGQAVIRIWSNLPQDVQDHLFKEAVASQGKSIRSQLAVFLHDRHSRTADPLGNPREIKEPDSLGG